MSITRYAMTARLPDINMTPPDQDEREWCDLREGERINRILEEFAPREVAEFYVEQLVHLDMLITLARAGNREAIDRYVLKHRLGEVPA